VRPASEPGGVSLESCRCGERTDRGVTGKRFRSFRTGDLLGSGDVGRVEREPTPPPLPEAAVSFVVLCGGGPRVSETAGKRLAVTVNYGVQSVSFTPPEAVILNTLELSSLRLASMQKLSAAVPTIAISAVFSDFV
jgi:hypothetical protein